MEQVETCLQISQNWPPSNHSCLVVTAFRPNGLEQKTRWQQKSLIKIGPPELMRSASLRRSGSQWTSKPVWTMRTYHRWSISEKDGTLWSDPGSTHESSGRLVNCLWELERIGLSSTFILCIVVICSLWISIWSTERVLPCQALLSLVKSGESGRLRSRAWLSLQW